MAASKFVPQKGAMFIRVATNANKYKKSSRMTDQLINRYIARGITKKAEEVRKEAEHLSSRTFATLPQLRKLGHPYARRHFRGRFKKGRAKMPAAAYFINKQSGEFNERWNVSKPVQLKSQVYAFVYNDSDHAIYMDGTKRMIRRPILTEANKRVNKRFGQIPTDFSILKWFQDRYGISTTSKFAN